MPDVFVEIGEGVTIAAEDVLTFIDKLGTDAAAIVSPRALLGLAVLLSAAEPVIVDTTEAAAAGGLNIPLDITTAGLLIKLWPQIKAYATTLAIQPVSQPAKAKGTS